MLCLAVLQKVRLFLHCPKEVDWWEFPIPGAEVFNNLQPRAAGTSQKSLLDQLAEASEASSASWRHFIDPGVRLHLPHSSGGFLAAVCWCLLHAADVVGFSWKQLARITFIQAVTLAFTTDFWQGEGLSYTLQLGKMLTWLIPILLWLCKLTAKWLQLWRAAVYTEEMVLFEPTGCWGFKRGFPGIVDFCWAVFECRFCLVLTSLFSSLPLLH